MMTKETLGMVVEDDCTIGELRNNRFGPEFEAALKKMWEHRGFPKEARSIRQVSTSRGR